MAKKMTSERGQTFSDCAPSGGKTEMVPAKTFSGESTGAPAVGKTFSGAKRSAVPAGNPIISKFFKGKQ